MKILKSVENFKAMVMERQDLVLQERALAKKIRDGCNFFSGTTTRTNLEDIARGVQLMRSYLSEWDTVNNKLFAIDTVIASRLEAEFLDSVVKMRTKKTRNEAGDIIPSAEFFFMPEGYKEDDYITIDERDIWFLKIVKAAISLQQIELVGKDDQEPCEDF